MAKILIKNGRIWDGERFFFSDVLTDGKLVSEIRENISEPADFVFNAEGKIVSPGLVDMHVHMKGLASATFGTEPHMSSFPFGVTAVNDAGSVYGDGALLDSFSVKSTVFVGSRIAGNHAEFYQTENLLTQYGDKAIGIKVYFDQTLSQVLDITPLQEICAYAGSRGLKVMVHCSNSPTTMKKIIETLSPGDILTHIYHGGENGCSDNDFEAFRLAGSKGVILDSGFAGFVHTDFANLEKSMNCGLHPDTISTDITCLSVFKRGGRYGLTMCMSMARRAGMSEADVMRAVTSTPAGILGKDAEWGRLKVGRIADIAVLHDTDEPFDLTDHAGNRFKSDRGYRCVLTVADGQVVYRD